MQALAAPTRPPRIVSARFSSQGHNPGPAYYVTEEVRFRTCAGDGAVRRAIIRQRKMLDKNDPDSTLAESRFSRSVVFTSAAHRRSPQLRRAETGVLRGVKALAEPGDRRTIESVVAAPS